MSSHLRRLVLIASMSVLVACSGNSDDGDALNGDATPTTLENATTTTALPPAAPTVRSPPVARAEIGQVFSDAIVVIDPNGDDTEVTISGRAPEGFATVVNTRGRVTGFQWEPVRAGEWTIDVVATDPGGLSTAAPLTLIARSPKSLDMVLALGDSIAAGFGRDRSDFVGSDQCFRSENDAYAKSVHATLVEAGSLGPESELVIAACAGASAQTMRTRSVTPTNGNGDIAGTAASQLEHATNLNPTIVTLTVGVVDVGLFDAAALTEPGADNDPIAARDEFLVNNSLERFSTNLDLVLEQLVRTTDAHIIITTLYDPTASIPNGVDGCKGSCFAALMEGVVDDTNAVILESVAAQTDGRISVARLDGDADVWEAKNGLGPDALRDRLGPLQGFVDNFTGGSSATCADEGGPDQDLISSLDCAHPNTAGHRAIADIVADTLLSISRFDLGEVDRAVPIERCSHGESRLGETGQ